MPIRNRAFWLEKFEKNVARDRRCVRSLRAAGFTVETVWECEIEIKPGRVAQRLRQMLAKRASYD